MYNWLNSGLKCYFLDRFSCFVHLALSALHSIFKPSLRSKLKLPSCAGPYLRRLKSILISGLREECRLRVFENRILRRIFGPKRDENGEWRRLNNEELHRLYHLPNIVRVIKSRILRLAGYVARMRNFNR